MPRPDRLSGVSVEEWCTRPQVFSLQTLVCALHKCEYVPLECYKM